MKILVISQEIGFSAPGIVFERILSELGNYSDLEMDIVACEYKPSIELKSVHVQIVNYPALHYRLRNLMISVFNRDMISDILKYQIKLKRQNYDVILALCSSGHLFGLVSGVYLSYRLNCKLGCYLVDAVPAPLGWSKNNRLYRSICKMADRLLREVDLIASVNQEMLNYQLSLFRHKKNLVSRVFFPPSLYSKVNYIPKEDDCVIRFLYTGNIYGLRTPLHVLEAFSLLYDIIPNIEFVFVGNTGGTVETMVLKYKKEIQDRVIVKPRVKDLMPYYKRSSILVDIDADIDNDVFLSSKMSSYITCNRPIICETGINSPSRNLFGKINSIIQCGHNPQEIYEAMFYAIKNYDSFDYNDRYEVLKIQSPQVVSKKVCDSLLYLSEMNSPTDEG